MAAMRPSRRTRLETSYFKCDGSKVHIFASQNTYEMSHLGDEEMSSSEGTYIGTLNG
jgi:hypothetical protein